MAPGSASAVTLRPSARRCLALARTHDPGPGGAQGACETCLRGIEPEEHPLMPQSAGQGREPVRPPHRRSLADGTADGGPISARRFNHNLAHRLATDLGLKHHALPARPTPL